ncbi:MFS transporter [Amycolatopsis sp. NPDC051903]|uniref:MFS transporter n=1 Tax=Amycolatopsis sp. NPDC051903 TaxID=3363936 RepID=UPI0037AE5050
MNADRRTHKITVHTCAIAALVLTFSMINFADKAALGLVELPLSKELGLSHGTYGLVASSFFLLFSLSSVVVGFLTNKFGARWIILILALLWSLAQVPLLAAASVATLFASRIALGATEGPAAAVAVHATLQWFPVHRRGLPSTFYTVGAGLGTFTAAPVLTWLVLRHGWRAAFVALVVVGVVWGALWLLIGREGPYAAEPDTRGAKTAAGAELRVPYRRLFTSPTWLGGTIAGFGAYWALAIGSAFVPAYLVTQHGFSPSTAALAVSVYASLYVVGPLVVSPIVSALRARGHSSRWTAGATQGAAVVLAGACLVLLPHATGATTVFVLVAVAFGIGVVTFPLAYVTTGEVTPIAQRGASLGTLIAVQSIPGLIAPAISGWLLDAAGSLAAGYVTVLTVGGVIMLVCGVIGIIAIRPERDAARLGLTTPAAPSRTTALEPR